jgi:hypothetical protein
MELSFIADDFANALVEVDATGIRYKNYQPGIGPFSESEAVKRALALLKRKGPPYE